MAGMFERLQQPKSMLPLLMGMNMLSANQPRPASQGPVTLGGVFGQAGQQTMKQLQEMKDAETAPDTHSYHALIAQGMAPREALRAIAEAKGKPKKRPTLKDAAGFHRYVDSGERVFPGAERKPETAGSPGTQTYRALIEQGMKPAEAFRELARLKRKPETAGAAEGRGLFPGVAKGGTAQERALAYLAHVQAKKDRLAPLTKDERRRAEAARSILMTPMTRFDPATQTVTTIEPPIPDWLKTPEEQGAETGAPGVQQTKIGQSEREKREGKIMEGLVSRVSEITDILNQPQGDIPLVPGTDTSGVEGWMKGNFGGLARQFGVPVSDRAAQVQRSLEEIKLDLAPLLTRESRLSNEERKRIDGIISSLGPNVDEVEMRQGLLRILDIVERHYGN